MSTFENTRAASSAVRAAQLPINTFDTGPRMVLDTGVHWTWRNPLNVIPAIVVALELISLASMMLR